MIREDNIFANSPIVIMVERNLGFEAEHHERALRNIPLVRHRVDHQAKRFGILTTEEIKYAMMTLLVSVCLCVCVQNCENNKCALQNTMLRDQRVNCLPEHELISQDPAANRKRLREQLGIYSFQYKAAANAFGKQRVALSGKVGGMKDDVAIALQLAIYYSAEPRLYM